MFFLSSDSPGRFDFSESGNPGGERPQPGDANSAIVADLNWFNYGRVPGYDEWWKPPGNAHGGAEAWTGPAQFAPFIDSNVLFGDGHVETRYEECENYVTRNVTMYYPY